MLWKRSLNFTLIVPKSFIIQATIAGPEAFVIEHQKKKRNICPSEESCNSFPISLSIRTWWKKNNSGYFRTATKVLQKENGPRVNSTWSEHFENFNLAGFSLSSATKKSRVQIQLQQPNKSFSTLIHSDGLRWKAAEAGIRETYTHSSQEVLEQEAFFPVAKDALLVRAA